MFKIFKYLKSINNRKSKNDILDSQEFYEVMQQYRCAHMINQDKVVIAFENVKNWIRKNY